MNEIIKTGMFDVYSKRALEIVPKIYILSLQRFGYFFCFLRKKFILSLIFSLCPGLGREWLERSVIFFLMKQISKSEIVLKIMTSI